MDDSQIQLLTEQFKHAFDLLRTDIQALRADVAHLRELTEARLSNVDECLADHEKRLRSVSEGVTQFKVWSSMANGGSGLASLIALIRSFF